jgi:esterase/lipase
MPGKIIIIHGLNNNMEAFFPLRDKLRSQGLEAEVLCLPGHGSDRKEALNYETALEYFDQNIKRMINGPYSVIAFSQGGLYMQLWLEKYQAPQPQAQVLLAPALYIRHLGKLSMIMSKLPSFAFILSPMPLRLRRYSYLNIWEYRTLFNKAKVFQKITTPMKVPTMILVDPNDELVEAHKIKSELDKRNSGAHVEFYERPYLKGRRPGKYHILFHPDYFKPDDWESFISKIVGFLKDH